MWNTMTMSRIAFVLLLAIAAVPAHADPLWPIEREFEANLGVFFLDTDTTIRVDATNSDHGTAINLEQDLGLVHTDRFRVDAYWRMFPRHRLRFMYFDSSASSSRQLHENIEFGDTTFPLDAFVDARFDLTIFEAAYEYSFLKRDNFEIAGTFGVHSMQVEMGLTAGAATNPDLGGVTRTGLAEATGPLPVFGLRGVWAFSDHYYIDAQAQVFALEFDNYGGNLQDYKVSFNWLPWKHVGVGVGYNLSSTRIDIDQDRYLGRVQLDYSGAQLFLNGAF